MFDLVILIPAFNEKDKLIKMLNKLNNHNILIVDDGSTDNTIKKIPKSKKIKIIKNNENKGYEYSILLGFRNLKK